MVRGVVVIAVVGVAALIAFVASGWEGSGSPVASSGSARCPVPEDVRREDFVRRVDNSYFPLEPGTTFVYRGRSDGERTRSVVSVTNRTKTILGITATVVRDRAYTGGRLAEDTEDWYAQDRAGTVWYLGEDTKEYEDGRVVSSEGSFQAGLKGAKAGVQMPEEPRVGQVAHTEFARGEAEDCFEVTGLESAVRTPHVSSRRALKRSEFTRLEPGLVERKHFVRGVGMVREETVEGGSELAELVSVRRGGR